VSEEIVQEEVVEETVEEVVEEKDPLESVARDMGWRPADEWEGDPAHHKTPAEWIAGAKKIMDQRGAKIDELDRGFRELKLSISANTKAAVAAARRQERERVIAERKAAFEEQDADKFTQADERLRELDKEEVSAPEVDVEVVKAEREFRSRNDWYMEDKKMTTYANKRAREIRSEFPALSPEEFFELIEDDVHREFRSKFIKEKPTKQAVESEGAPPAKKSDTGWNSLDKDVRAVAQSLIDDGTFKDHDEYMKYYKEAYNV